MRGLLLTTCAAITLFSACGAEGSSLPNGGALLAELTVDQLVETCTAWQGLTDTDWYQAATRLECFIEAREDDPSSCEQQAQACIQAYGSPRPKPGADRRVLEELSRRLAESTGCARELGVDDIDACFREMVAGYAALSGTASCTQAMWPAVPTCDALFTCDEFDSAGMWTLLVEDAQCLWSPNIGDF